MLVRASHIARVAALLMSAGVSNASRHGRVLE